jgi:FkbM family methyltransferase
LARTDLGIAYRVGSPDEWILRETSYRRLLRAIRPGDRVLDIGGYIGTFAAEACLAGALVISYEASSTNYAVLAENARHFGFTAVNQAVIPVPGTSVTFYAANTARQLPYGSTRMKSRNYTATTVPAQDVHLIQDRFMPNFVKIDIEGTECDVAMALTLTGLRGVAIEYDLQRAGQRAAAIATDDHLRSQGLHCSTLTVREHSVKLRSIVKTYLRTP